MEITMPLTVSGLRATAGNMLVIACTPEGAVLSRRWWEVTCESKRKGHWVGVQGACRSFGLIGLSTWTLKSTHVDLGTSCVILFGSLVWGGGSLSILKRII